jgi:hypothetical protein
LQFDQFGRVITNTYLANPNLSVTMQPNSGTGCGGLPPSAANSQPVNSAAAQNLKIISNAAGKYTYVCAYELQSAGTNNVAVVYGTGTNCATGTTALIGGSTAAAGYNFTAQTGIVRGDGNGVLFKVPPPNDVCIITSAAVQLSGSMTYTQY